MMNMMMEPIVNLKNSTRKRITMKLEETKKNLKIKIKDSIKSLTKPMMKDLVVMRNIEKCKTNINKS